VVTCFLQLRERCILACDQICADCRPADPTLPMAADDFARRLMKVQVACNGTLNNKWAEKSRLKVQQVIPEQIRHARRTFVGRLVHLEPVDAATSPRQLLDVVCAKLDWSGVAWRHASSAYTSQTAHRVAVVSLGQRPHGSKTITVPWGGVRRMPTCTVRRGSVPRHCCVPLMRMDGKGGTRSCKRRLPRHCPSSREGENRRLTASSLEACHASGGIHSLRQQYCPGRDARVRRRRSCSMSHDWVRKQLFYIYAKAV
jgi:hypothetical protein